MSGLTVSREAMRLLARPSMAASRAATSWNVSGGRKRRLHASAQRKAVKPYLLADIGEGITEVQIIQWFVQPGARVEQFDKICEVQSDKATVEISSRFDGIIKKLYYEADDTARVGKPLVDIDIKSEISPEDEALTKIPGEEPKSNGTSAAPVPPSQNEAEAPKSESSVSSEQQTPSSPVAPSPGKHAALATPAVRHLIKELNLTITDVQGTGKDGRVLKEDVQRHAAAQKEESASLSASASAFIPKATAEDKTLSLTPIQTQMFKTMTRSLSIPHFLYSEAVDFSTLNRARKRVNTIAAANNGNGNAPTTKLSALPFVIKAVSLALQQYPILNSLLDTSTAKPQIFQKGTQNIGIAIDTPSGLIVPVIRSVESHSIASLAAEIQRLSQLARANKLSPADLSDATFTISNIGSIGGGAVAPVIVPPQVAILAVGKAKVVPAFDEDGELVRREECVLSWSADHRVVDGATVARCAELVKTYLEDVESMLVNLR